jgi:hypothetical protein
MAFEHKPGSFSLFKNDRKEKDTHPDYKGEGMSLYGEPIWVSAWIKRTERGTFMSCSITLKEAKPAAKPASQARENAAAVADGFEEDIPFANPYRGRLSYLV